MRDTKDTPASDLLERGADLDVIDLATLGDRHLASLGRLAISPRQEILGGSFAETLMAWRAGPAHHVLGYGFLLEGAPVGTVLFKRPPASPVWAPDDVATMHGLKIATPLQGRGWGQRAFHLSVDRLKREWPTARALMLAVDAVNTVALSIYRMAGMVDIGPRFEGRNGLEHRLEMPLGR